MDGIGELRAEVEDELVRVLGSVELGDEGGSEAVHGGVAVDEGRLGLCIGGVGDGVTVCAGLGDFLDAGEGLAEGFAGVEVLFLRAQLFTQRLVHAILAEQRVVAPDRPDIGRAVADGTFTVFGQNVADVDELVKGRGDLKAVLAEDLSVVCPALDLRHVGDRPVAVDRLVGKVERVGLVVAADLSDDVVQLHDDACAGPLLDPAVGGVHQVGQVVGGSAHLELGVIIVGVAADGDEIECDVRIFFHEGPGCGDNALLLGSAVFKVVAGQPVGQGDGGFGVSLGSRSFFCGGGGFGSFGGSSVGRGRRICCGCAGSKAEEQHSRQQQRDHLFHFSSPFRFV